MWRCEEATWLVRLVVKYRHIAHDPSTDSWLQGGKDTGAWHTLSRLGYEEMIFEFFARTHTT